MNRRSAPAGTNAPAPTTSGASSGKPAGGMSIEDLIVALPTSTQPATLQAIVLSNRGITKLPNQLAFLAALRRLDLSNNALTDVSPLAKVPTLSQLKLSHNALRDLRPIAGLAKLTVLDVGNNRLASLAGVEAMLALKALIVPDNQLTDLTALTAHASAGGQLETLVVSRNPLHEPDAATPLDDLKALRKLSASQCGLKALPALDLPLVTELRLSGNALEEFPAETRFRSLQIIDMSNNKLASLASLTPFALFVQQLSLRGNPVAASENATEERAWRRMVARLFKSIKMLDGKAFDRIAEMKNARRPHQDNDDDDAAAEDDAANAGSSDRVARKQKPEAPAPDLVFEGTVPEVAAAAQRTYVRRVKSHRPEAPVAAPPQAVPASPPRARIGHPSYHQQQPPMHQQPNQRYQQQQPQQAARSAPEPLRGAAAVAALAAASDPLSASGW